MRSRRHASGHPRRGVCIPTITGRDSCGGGSPRAAAQGCTRRRSDRADDRSSTCTRRRSGHDRAAADGRGGGPRAASGRGGRRAPRKGSWVKQDLVAVHRHGPGQLFMPVAPFGEEARRSWGADSIGPPRGARPAESGPACHCIRRTSPENPTRTGGRPRERAGALGLWCRALGTRDRDVRPHRDERSVFMDMSAGSIQVDPGNGDDPGPEEPNNPGPNGPHEPPPDNPSGQGRLAD